MFVTRDATYTLKFSEEEREQLLNLLGHAMNNLEKIEKERAEIHVKPTKITSLKQLARSWVDVLLAA